MPDQKGNCKCGAVSFEISGDPMMNLLCHCNNCSTGIGCSPVHLYAAPNDKWKITKGEDKIKEFKGDGALRFYRCINCASPVYQCPEGGPFGAFYPRAFEGYVDGKINKMPEDLLPKLHINYENRCWDFNDDLPKFAAFPGKDMVNNDGSPKE